MTYVKVTVSSFLLRAVTLAMTLPTESPYLHALKSTEDNHISPETPEIRHIKLLRSQDDDRVDDLLLPKPVAESEETKSLSYETGMNENGKGEKRWRLVTLPSQDDEMPEDVTSKLAEGAVLDPSPTRAVSSRREPTPFPTGHYFGSASSTSQALEDDSAPGLDDGRSPHHQNDTSDSRTKRADVVDDDLEFFWSWEAILLVALPAAWLVLVATLCFLTRSSPGRSLLQKLCPPPDDDGGGGGASLGHGIGFFDGSPGMRRRMTQCVEIPAALAGMKDPTTEHEEEQEEEEEESNGGSEGREMAGKPPPADEGFPPGGRQGGLGALDDYQRVLRKLSLIQEEVSP